MKLPEKKYGKKTTLLVNPQKRSTCYHAVILMPTQTDPSWGEGQVLEHTYIVVHGAALWQGLARAGGCVDA
jgi:hypothetical protein